MGVAVSIDDAWDEAQESAWETERDLQREADAYAEALRAPEQDRCGALACGLQVDGHCYRAWGCEVGT